MSGASGFLAITFSAFLLFAVVGHVAAVKPIPRVVAEEEDGNRPILQESIIREVNSNPNAGWEADYNPRLADYTFSDFKVLLGVKPMANDSTANVPTKTYPDSLSESLPKEFDARTAWPNCSSIGRIHDQGHCGSCWAFAAVEVVADRFCIQHGEKVSLSANDLLSCCLRCAGNCIGGFPTIAWYRMMSYGVVTEECDPYFDKEGCPHKGGCSNVTLPFPTCEEKCKGGPLGWYESKHFVDDYYIFSLSPESIMTEIYHNGPVQASFMIYEDFAHYKSGVYKHVTGKLAGGHSARIIGWGTSETGEDYWLVANSWNKRWGDHGFFKIKRGTNECGIEGQVIGGTMSPHRLFPKS